MGSSDRNHTPRATPRVDGVASTCSTRSSAGGRARPPRRLGPANLAGLNEISNKVTPVMLAR